MDKLDMRTCNIAEKNYEILSKLFPNAITEAIDEDGKVVRAIDVDILKQEISCTLVEGKDERYQFNWPDKKKTILKANEPISATLRPYRNESIDYNETQNLYIEGDNLEVLKLLQETYLEKIKMIYIDPPYNTGGDFLYEDDFSEEMSTYMEKSGQFDEYGNRLVQNTESNGRFHTDWLNMLYPRLKVARNLLTTDGVIFISIDENEITNLKNICNEIFGEENLVAVLHVEMSATQGMKVKAAQNGNIVKNAEYVVIYSKDGHKNIAKKILYDYRPVYDNHYTKYLTNKNEVENVVDVYNKKSATKIKNVVDAYADIQEFREFVEENAEHIFRYDKTTGFSANDFEVGKIVKVERGGRQYTLQRKNNAVEQLMFLSASFGQCDDFKRSKGFRKIRGDWWKEFYLDMGNVSKEGNVVFANGKKPVRLIKQLCMMCTSDDDIILDFFSGSATTGQAVIESNLEDDNNRKYILVQLPETINEGDTICDIAKKRLRNVKEQYQNEDVDAGFRVLKVDTSNMKDVYYNPAETEQTLFDLYVDNIKEDRTPEDLLFQVMLDLGVPLSSKIEETTIANKKVLSVADEFLIACFDDTVSEETVKAVAEKKPYYAIFRDCSMANDSVTTNFDQIFEAISPDTVRKVL